METKDNGKNRILLYGIFGAVITWLCGFGVMYLFWRKIGTINGLPGFFDYHAATYGDGLCLPILVGTGIAFLKNNKRDYELVDIRKCRWIAILMALIGGLIQASWLISARTTLNWSIPIQHHFNIAGWYHSIFFIGMFGVIAYLLAGIWCTIRNKTSDYTWLDKDLLLIFVTVGTLFVLLFVSDDYPQYIENGIAYPVICLGIMFTLEIACRIANKEASAEIMFANSIGVIGGLGVFFLIIFEERGDIALTIAGMLCTCFLWKADKHTYKQIVFMSIYMFVVFGGIFNILSTGISVEKAVLILVTLCVSLCMYDKYYFKNKKRSGIRLALVGAYIYLSVFITDTPLYDFLTILFPCIIRLFFIEEIGETFNIIVEYEEKKNSSEIDEKNFVRTRQRAYVQIVAGIIAIVVMLCKWLVQIADTQGKVIKTGNLYFNKWCVCGIGMALGVALAIVFINNRKIIQKVVCRRAMLIAVICAYILIIVNMGIYFSRIIKEPLYLDSFIMLCFVFFANAGGAAMLRHGYEMNLITLRSVERKEDIICMSYVIGINAFIVSYLTSYIILVDLTWKSAFVCAINIFLTILVLPLLSAEVLKVDYRETKVVPNKPVGGIAQDGLMAFIIILFVAYLPCLYCRAVDWKTVFVNFYLNNSIVWEQIIGYLIGLFGLIIEALKPVEFCLGNNLKHLTRQYKTAKNENEIEIWEELHKCLNIQSKQAVFATLPYVVIILVKEYLNMSDDEKGHWKECFIEKYIDKKSYD